jgi:DNA repair photolyase
VLFPDWTPPAKLVGIAKLAAEGPLLEAKRRVEYHDLPSRSYIGRCSSPRMPFRFTINPYRGCEFACKYCYARYTHEFMELRDPEDFELRVFAKHWNPRAFRAELSKTPRDEPLAIGTATDPYQPAERRYGITRNMLKILTEGRGRRVWITTKSDLVTRDLPVLETLREHNEVHVNITVTTLDERLARMLEPLAPRPSLRIEAIRKIAAAGIPCGVLCCPLMPLINDSVQSIETVAREAAEAGASWLFGNVLFLKPCAKQVFLPFLEQEFPHLVRRYRERFERSAFLRGEYPAMISRRVAAIRERFGLNRRDTLRYDPALFAADSQLALFEGAAEQPVAG